MTERLEEGFRAFAGVHDVDDAAHTVAVDYPIAIDTYKTDFGHRCFEDGWRKSLPVMVENHDTGRLIGRATEAESLPDRHRLISKFADFEAVPQARAAFANIRDGIYPGFSFHYVQAKSIAHPTERGARRFTVARMVEHGPVIAPSIPGAVATGIRAEEATMETPTLDQILKLKADGLLDDEGVRAMIAESNPSLAEHIRISTPTPSKPPAVDADGRAEEAFRSAVAVAAAQFDLSALALADAQEGQRTIALAIHHDGSVSDGDGNQIVSGSPDLDDIKGLAAAISTTHDAANSKLSGVDLDSLPPEVQGAIHLFHAGHMASQELNDALGIGDPLEQAPGDDERSEAEMDAADVAAGVRAVLGTKDRNDLPDSAFAYVEPGGTKDAEGKTVPRSKRHFPIIIDGKPDHAHVINALARIGAGAKFSDQAKPKVLAAAKKLKIDVEDDGKRSDEDRQAAIDAALGKINAHVPAA